MSGPLPAPSEGVVARPLGPGLVVLDPRRIEVHVLNETGALVWQACGTGLDAGEVAAALAERTGTNAATIAPEVTAMVATLVELGLLGQVDEPPAVASPVDPPTGAPAVALAVLDEVVAVEADDERRALVADAFGPLRTARPPTRSLAIDRTEGGLRLHGGGHDATFAGGAELLDALATQLNRVAPEARSLLALHAAALRSAGGEVLVLVGASEAGKSTFAAALVADGWDYLTDEAVGIAVDGSVVGYPKPLALDGGSRRLVGATGSSWGGELVPLQAIRPDAVPVPGDVGPVDAVLVVDRGAEGVGDPLERDEAVAVLAGHALNLHASRAVGLEALVGLAEAAPVRPVGTKDLVRAVRDVGPGTQFS